MSEPRTAPGLAPGLTEAELARAERWKRVLTVSCTFKIDCWKDAEALTNQFEFVKKLIATGRLNEGAL